MATSGRGTSRTPADDNSRRRQESGRTSFHQLPVDSAFSASCIGSQVRLALRFDDHALGALLLNGYDRHAGAVCQREVTGRLVRSTGLRPQPEYDDLPHRSIVRFRSVGRIERLSEVHGKFADVRDLPAGSLEEAEGAPVLDMPQYRGIPRLHLLVTALAFARVVEAAVILPTIDVAVLSTARGVRDPRRSAHTVHDGQEILAVRSGDNILTVTTLVALLVIVLITRKK